MPSYLEEYAPIRYPSGRLENALAPIYNFANVASFFGKLSAHNGYDDSIGLFAVHDAVWYIFKSSTKPPNGNPLYSVVLDPVPIFKL